MTQYLLLVHDNVKTIPSSDEWGDFFRLARESGFFKGGSALGERTLIGYEAAISSSEDLGGYMRFDTNDKGRLLTLLAMHPVVVHGGTIELFELSRS